MADGTGLPVYRRSRTGEAFRAAILARHRESEAEFFEPRRYRTFLWYLAVLRIALEESLRPLRPSSQVPADEETSRLAREVLGIARELHSDHGAIIDADVAARLLWEALRSPPLYEAVAHRVIAEIGDHLKNAEEAATIKRGRRVHKLPRRSPRLREMLPDPAQPAWAGVNRMPSRKVQMPCRVEPDIKNLIEGETADAGISQSRWLEEAIAEKLQRAGHPVYLMRPVQVPEERHSPPRRTRRASLPQPEQPRGAAANRADKVTTVRINKALAQRIDSTRGQRDRSAWLNDALQAFIQADAALPEPPAAREALAVAISLSVDRAIFPEIEAAAARHGLTRSEWFRRVARWYLSEQK